MSDVVISRAVLNRLRAPDELALAQRIFKSAAATAESLETATKFAFDYRAQSACLDVAPARQAFLEAVSLSAPGAKYAIASKEAEGSPPIYLNKKAALAASALREVRSDFKRCNALYADGQLLPVSVFMAALQLPPYERIQRHFFYFTPLLIKLRDELVKEYLRIKRAIILQPRAAGSCNAFIQNSVPDSGRGTAEQRKHWVAKLCQKSCLVVRWEAFERRWLQEKEHHAVVALQSLVSTVAAAEAILKSCKKQLILAEPSASKQRFCTFRALKAFCSSIMALANNLFPLESSCLFLEASILVLAAAIVDAARDPAGTQSHESPPQRNRVGSKFRTVGAEGVGKQGESQQRTRKNDAPYGIGVWSALHLAALTEVANLEEEDIVVYRARQTTVNAAHHVLVCFFELLWQVWDSRVCLTQVDPELTTSCPSLVTALRNFSRAYATFRPPACCQNCEVLATCLTDNCLGGDCEKIVWKG
ncbi:uncharacterized protein LOC34619242 [Cyclospora cayetanensis]|uniref:Uncharacterized protein LOC34619242 n=1 Tax=Cyclospora cayetanensis TaxID=88456 RepID=A0A6P6RWB6_9EIME|nr:uncharacterized protein LOC34619242 [Cyclospora cayetanensis]